MANSANSEDGEMGFQIAPMVDVVFVLLLFFMAIVGSKVLRMQIATDIPGAGISRPQNLIVVEITAEGVVSVNDQIMGQALDHQLTDLRGWLKGIVTEFGDTTPVLLRPSPQTRQERIIDVLNACVAENVKKLTFG